MNATDQSEQLCPECGAPRVDGMDCWWQMGAVCAWEWQDSELAALHFVTVASYNLQHPAQFSEETLAALKRVYIAHLDEGMAVSEIRKRVGEQTDGNVKVLRKEEARKPVRKHWALTIADVYLADQPQGAAQRVKTWASTIRKELEG